MSAWYVVGRSTVSLHDGDERSVEEHWMTTGVQLEPWSTE